MPPTLRVYFRLLRRPSWNPAAEFVNTSSSIIGSLDLGPQPSARLRPAKRAGGHRFFSILGEVSNTPVGHSAP